MTTYELLNSALDYPLLADAFILTVIKKSLIKLLLHFTP